MAGQDSGGFSIKGFEGRDWTGLDWTEREEKGETGGKEMCFKLSWRDVGFYSLGWRLGWLKRG